MQFNSEIRGLMSHVVASEYIDDVLVFSVLLVIKDCHLRLICSIF